MRLFNERGAVGLVLKISDEVLPGVVLVPGQRPDQETLDGTVNMLCSDRYTDLGDGATYQSTFLDIAAWALNRKTVIPAKARDPLFSARGLSVGPGLRRDDALLGRAARCKQRKRSTRQRPSARVTLRQTASGKRAAR